MVKIDETNLVDYVESSLAEKGITEEDHSNSGQHLVRTNDIYLESKFIRTLRARGGIELGYGYIISHSELKGTSSKCARTPTEFGRNMPFEETDITTTFSGERIYYVSLADEPTGMDLFKIDVWKGKITELNISESDNHLYNEFQDVRVGELAGPVVDRMIKAYLNLPKDY